MNSTLYVATGNTGKLRDFAAAAAIFGVDLQPLPGLDAIPAPPEDEDSFEGNARGKALFYARFGVGLIVLADDSGLEVDALGGAPGVRSARYAADARVPNPDCLPEDVLNNQHLLAQLQEVGSRERSARYRCVLAAARDGILVTASGTVEGQISLAPRGSLGFGYDPLFFLPELNRTMAEVDLATKQTFSHRGRALRALLTQLRS